MKSVVFGPWLAFARAMAECRGRARFHFRSTQGHAPDRRFCNSSGEITLDTSARVVRAHSDRENESRRGQGAHGRSNLRAVYIKPQQCTGRIPDHAEVMPGIQAQRGAGDAGGASAARVAVDAGLGRPAGVQPHAVGVEAGELIVDRLGDSLDACAGAGFVNPCCGRDRGPGGNGVATVAGENNLRRSASKERALNAEPVSSASRTKRKTSCKKTTRSFISKHLQFRRLHHHRWRSAGSLMDIHDEILIDHRRGLDGETQLRHGVGRRRGNVIL